MSSSMAIKNAGEWITLMPTSTRKKTQSTNTYSLSGKRRIYSKFCIIYGVQFTMFFRCYLHRICCHFGTSTFYDITPLPCLPAPSFRVYSYYTYFIHIVFISETVTFCFVFICSRIYWPHARQSPAIVPYIYTHIYIYSISHTYIYVYPYRWWWL